MRPNISPHSPDSICTPDAFIAHLQTLSPLASLTNAPITLATHQAHRHVLAAPAIARVDMPRFDNSQMDGYAIHIAPARPDKQHYTVIGTVSAGDRKRQLPLGQAARIFTGAVMPNGANAVVPKEQAMETMEGICVEHVAVGDCVRHAGHDFQEGAVLLGVGHRISLTDIALLASAGISEVTAFRPLRIALVSSGNELATLGEVPPEILSPSAIYDSNRVVLRAMLEHWGFEVVSDVLLPDDRAHIEHHLATIAQTADVIVSSGGVSVGDADHMRQAVAALGGIDAWRVNMKPGKPLAIGHIGQADTDDAAITPFIGLPGNPVSAVVSLLVLARVALFRLQGVAVVGLPEPMWLDRAEHAALENISFGERENFMRVHYQHGELTMFAQDASHLVGILSKATGLLRIPTKPTDRLAYYPFHAFGV